MKMWGGWDSWGMLEPSSILFAYRCNAEVGVVGIQGREGFRRHVKVWFMSALDCHNHYEGKWLG